MCNPPISNPLIVELLLANRNRPIAEIGSLVLPHTFRGFQSLNLSNALLAQLSPVLLDPSLLDGIAKATDNIGHHKLCTKEDS